MDVAVVVAEGSPYGTVPQIAVDRVAAGIADAVRGRGHRVDVLHLAGFAAAMSPAERAAYFTAEPIIDPTVAAHAEVVRRCTAIVVVFGSVMSSVPPSLKGWLDRVMVPGVSFTLDDEGKVHRGLGHVAAIVGVALHDGSRWETARCRNLGRRVVLRAFRSCASLRTRTAWFPLYRAGSADLAAFARRVEHGVPQALGRRAR